jgi:hypothetical protein
MNVIDKFQGTCYIELKRIDRNMLGIIDRFIIFNGLLKLKIFKAKALDLFSEMFLF